MSTDTEPRHGTWAGYEWHFARGEKACEACKVESDKMTRALMESRGDLILARDNAKDQLALNHPEEYQALVKADMEFQRKAWRRRS